MIIFIHGFGSDGHGSKATLLRQYCAEQHIPFIAPSLSTIPDLAISTLEELIQQWQPHGEVKLVGSSLGGFYAMYLANKYGLAVQHVQSLNKYQCAFSGHRCLLLLQTGDAVLDYRQAVAALPDARQVVEQGGDHGFAGFARYLTEITAHSF